jgi:hypothetical protein
VRRMVVIFAIAMMVTACGGSAATTLAPTVAPSPTASPAAPASTLASPSASETASPTAGSSGAGAFAEAGLAASVDVGGGPPDPSTFGTSFASETPQIFVPYVLAPGLSGKVSSTWKSGGTDVNVASFDYPAGAPWAYFRLTYVDGFIPGDYEEVLTFEQTGESVTLPFTITGPRRPSASPTALPSGSSAFTLLRAATTADSSKSLPDPSTFTDSLPTTAPAIFVVFSLRSGLTGTVTCIIKANGSALVQPLSLDYGANNSWGDFKITPAGSFPAGYYEATLTYEPSGETKTISFTVK